MVKRCKECSKALKYYNTCVNQPAEDYSRKDVDQKVLSFLSGVFLLGVGFFFLLNKKFHIHPFQFTAAACLA